VGEVVFGDDVSAAGRRGFSHAFAFPLAFLLTGTLMRLAAWHFGTNAEDGGFVEAFCRWDCEWYAGIVADGYDRYPVQDGPRYIGNWAFFPLYPLVVKGAATVLPLPIEAVAMIVSAVLSVGTCLVAWPLLGRDRATHAIFCAFVLAGPFSMYFTTFLTESLFVLLCVAVVAACRRGDLLLAAALCALASATRIIGVFLVLLIAWRMFEEHRRDGGTLLGLPARVLSRPDWLVAIFVAPAGLFAYMLFLAMHMGDGFAFAHVQRAWNRDFAMPWQHLWQSLVNFGGGSTWWPRHWQLNALAALAAIGVAIWIAARRQLGLAAFLLVSVLLPLSSGVASQVRFLTAMLPPALAAHGPMRIGTTAAAVIVVLLHVAGLALTIAWLRGAYALI
jgi:Gpi18-like mannosyltransferase